MVQFIDILHESLYMYMFFVFNIFLYFLLAIFDKTAYGVDGLSFYQISLTQAKNKSFLYRYYLHQMMTDSQHGETRSMCFKGPFMQRKSQNYLLGVISDVQRPANKEDIYQTFYAPEIKDQGAYCFCPVCYLSFCHSVLLSETLTLLIPLNSECQSCDISHEYSL